MTLARLSGYGEDVPDEPGEDVPDEPMDEATVRKLLSQAAVDSARLVLTLALASTWTPSADALPLAERCERWLADETAHLRQLASQLFAMGARPSLAPDEVALPERWADLPAALLEAECASIEALAEVIPYTGTEGRSEALEHLVEHAIFDKQQRVNALLQLTHSGQEDPS